MTCKTTCYETGPVSGWWCYMRFEGLGVALEQIRIDRQFEEATAAGADPLHLAAVFGIPESVVAHYASAWALLETALEDPEHR